MSYLIPKIFSFISSISTIAIVGFFLIQEYYDNSYKNLEYNEKVYSSLVLYSELNLLFVIVYIILSCIWSGIILCCNDTDESICQFNLPKVVFLLSGVGTNVYLFILLTKSKSIVNKTLTTCGWMLIGNLIFVITVTSINKLYVLSKKNNKINYGEL